jgi:hypothetical protein
MFDWIFSLFKKKDKFAVTNAGLVFRVEEEQGDTYRLSKGRFEVNNGLRWVKGNFEDVNLTRKQIKKFVSAKEAEQLLTKIN